MTARRRRTTALRSLLALLLLVLGAPGCPALLDDDFVLVSAPDASIAGSGGAAVRDASAGTTAETGVSGSAGMSGTGGADSSDGGCVACAAADCCDGRCVDVTTNSEHCMSCGTGCPGTSCDRGCTNNCRFGFLDCDHNIVTGCEVNAATDPENCGSCGIACGFGVICVSGKCMCAPNTANCDGDVGEKNGCETDIGKNPLNCGACGRKCGANQVCSDGKCVCKPGFDDCNQSPNDGCEAMLDDPKTCGSCQTNCGQNSTCVASTCGCTAGFLDCDASVGCEAPATSPQSCAICTRKCSAPTPVCNGTACVSGCTPPETLCGGVSCVNLGTDPSNCGSCSRALGSNQRCVAGVPTCMPGFGDCNGQSSDGCEVDLRSDSNHCGSCPTVCKPGAICSQSQCQCAANNPNDCGADCRQCCTAAHCSDGNSCTTDTCSSSGTCANSAACAPDKKCCGGQGCFECCADTDCVDNKVCSGNTCVTPTCVLPQILCDGQCVDPNADPAHCDGCNKDCGTGRSCSARRCTPPWVMTAAPPATLVARAKAAYTWTGSAVFVWGGATQATAGDLNTGALYNPATNSWATTAVDANTPSARVLATAVWTGNVVVVWGGGDAAGNTDFKTGGRYNPATNSWLKTSENGAPQERRGAVGVWTGSRVLIWGGYQKNGAPEDKTYLYDPVNDEWSLASTSTNPPKLIDATTGWSGSEFYVWGGSDAARDDNDLYRYHAGNNVWSLLVMGMGNLWPAKRSGAAGGWDGNQFVVWGGRKAVGQHDVFNDGMRFDPTSSTWAGITAANVPIARSFVTREHGWSARVSAGRMLMLGGFSPGFPLTETLLLKNGAIYNSTTNTWTHVDQWPSLESHQWGAGVWTGSEFFLWGGLNNGAPTNTGERLLP